MKHIILVPFFILVFTYTSLANTGYHIAVKWEGLKDTSIYLAHYYDTHILVDDTIRLNQKGEGIFSDQRTLKQGLYLLYLNENNYIDFLLGADQTLSVSIVNSDLRGKLSITGAVESEKFLHYQNFLRQLSERKAKLNEELQKDRGNEAVVNQIKDLDGQMTTYVESEMKMLPGSMYNLFMNAVAPPKNPAINVSPDHPKYDSIAWHTQYNFRVKHFLDGIDFADSRILYTPLLKPKIEAYFNQVLLQVPDTIIQYGLRLIEASKPDVHMFQYMSQYLLNWGLQAKIMGMDAVFVAVADQVYLKGLAIWADSTTLAKINEEAFFLRNNLVGSQARPLNILTVEETPFSLYDLKAKYTILVFWEPECGHCKKEVPALYNEVYLKHLDKGLEVVAVYTGAKKEEWIEFIGKNELEGWHHVYDPNHRSGYRYFYNVRSTPQLFLLDKEKKIIAKRLDYETIGKLIENMENNK